MKIGVLGTGVVGKTIADALVARGHEVVMGSRLATGETVTAWADAAGERGTAGTFADAARAGDVVFHCTGGKVALAALEAAGAENLAGKILVELANPLDFSQGFPPSLTVCNTDSLAETIQRAHPEARVVKTLNTMNCGVMVDPGQLAGPTEVFVCGDDPDARAQVAAWLTQWFGWGAAIDLGDLSAARGLEAWLLLWPRLYQALGTADFNIRIVKKDA